MNTQLPKALCILCKETKNKRKLETADAFENMEMYKKNKKHTHVESVTVEITPCERIDKRASYPKTRKDRHLETGVRQDRHLETGVGQDRHLETGVGQDRHLETGVGQNRHLETGVGQDKE